jgi:predicted Ser/Thr protein kinase
VTKAYSNKALPSGTVLREWRLEEVLGVGGFGIVYKGRGIYFDELVAIKEYFPSSISERESDATVVPIDSDAEEVHALGLKKFVEEAKLLWNLSTPTRHPNIVSVRSLFEIHGTAYMVMDFEDGISLSKMLKQGRRFNERSLWGMLRPVAEGLERAHRVGVLHRDIKPPNILINEDNRPVLIDFGSARFDTAEATSTKVTFHTPPYAAIEQYVKTYPQGPWTDIYALGVVMYECVTGEKPPEVLERLHAGLGKPLAEGRWPGYGKRFLQAIDAAMVVKPDERPQSITEWLAMFGKPAGADEVEADEATRFFAGQIHTDEIVPVAPTNGDRKTPVETGVPVERKEARFKRAGQETDATKKHASEEQALGKPAAAAAAAAEPVAAAAATPLEAAPPKAPKTVKGAEPASAKKKPNMALIGGAAAAVLAVVVGGVLTLGRGSDSDTGFQMAKPAAQDSGQAAAVLGPSTAPTDTNATFAVTDNSTAPQAAPQASEEVNAAEALRSEKAKTAAAQAQLAALKKAQAKAALPAAPGAPPTTRKGRAAAAAAAEVASSDAQGGVSAAKMAQFNAAVSEARSMARQAMRSSNSQNAQLAKNYDKYLKTLDASMRGVQSDREADKLIHQANQTKAYITFLLRQP